MSGVMVVIASRNMNYKETFSKMIQEGAFDKRLSRRVGHGRVWRHGIEQLRDATDPLVAGGKMTEKEQKELVRELAKRIVDRLER